MYMPQKSAEALVAELQSQGVNDVEIFIKKKILRVVVGSYPTEASAHEALREYRKMSKHFNQAWVYKK